MPFVLSPFHVFPSIRFVMGQQVSKVQRIHEFLRLRDRTELAGLVRQLLGIVAPFRTRGGNDRSHSSKPAHDIDEISE